MASLLYGQIVMVLIYSVKIDHNANKRLILLAESDHVLLSRCNSVMMITLTLPSVLKVSYFLQVIFLFSAYLIVHPQIYQQSLVSQGYLYRPVLRCKEDKLMFTLGTT